MKYNRMKKFSIREISAVDNPAQGEGARVAIMKRADLEKKHALLDPMDGHTHTLSYISDDTKGESSFNGNNDDQHHSHPWIHGMNGELIVGHTNGHTHRVGFFSKQGDSTPVADATNPTEENTMNEEEFNKKLEEIQKQLDETAARADKSELVAKMTDVQKAHYATLEGDDAKSFLESDTKDAVITKANEADPVVGEFEGKEIRKSDDPTGVLAALLEKAKHDKKKADKDEDDKKKFAFEAKKAELEKRVATGDYKNLPGTDEMKAEMLKALDSIEDESTREAAHAALVAKNKELEGAFTEVGTAIAPDPITKSTFDKIDAIRDEILRGQPELTKSAAYVLAIESKEGLELYAELQAAPEVN